MTLQDVEKSLEAAWKSLVAEVHSLFHKDAVVAEAGKAPAEVATPQSAVAEAPPADFSPAPPPGVTVEPPKPAEPVPANPSPPPSGIINTTDPTAPGFVAPPATVVAPVDTSPVIDTSGDTLDFKVVGNGIPINLTGPKTIVNCPESVTVQINLQSGQSGATPSYKVTVNGVTSTQENSQAQFTAPASGPTVNVSVSCPGLQMEIRG